MILHVCTVAHMLIILTPIFIGLVASFAVFSDTRTQGQTKWFLNSL